MCIRDSKVEDNITPVMQQLMARVKAGQLSFVAAVQQLVQRFGAGSPMLAQVLQDVFAEQFNMAERGLPGAGGLMLGPGQPVRRGTGPPGTMQLHQVPGGTRLQAQQTGMPTQPLRVQDFFTRGIPTTGLVAETDPGAVRTAIAGMGFGGISPEQFSMASRGVTPMAVGGGFGGRPVLPRRAPRVR